MLKTSLRSCGDSGADSPPLCLVSPTHCFSLPPPSWDISHPAGDGVFSVAFAFCMLSFLSLYFLFGELDLLVAY